MTSASNWNEVYQKMRLEYPKIVFLYNIPKVGSTTMISSLRLYFSRKIHLYHFHDFQPFHASIYPFQHDTFWEFIDYLVKEKHHQVYFIDIFREPIEHKISFFFDHFRFHFPASEDHPPSMAQIRKRFNQCFPYLAQEDYFFTRYNLPVDSIPSVFPSDGALTVEHQGVHFLKLRLRDVAQWGTLVEKFIGFRGRGLRFFKDNATTQPTYTQFVSEYHPPITWLEETMTYPCIQFYLSETERAEYESKWRAKLAGAGVGDGAGDEERWWTPEEYTFYATISHENYPIIRIDRQHYFDEGCVCSACMLQRKSIIQEIARTGSTATPKIFHQEAKLTLLKKQLSSVVAIKKHKTATNNESRFGKFIKY